MSYEGLQPYEMAAQLADSGYEIVNGRVESERLADLVDRSQPVWRQLLNGKFEESDHGHVSIGVEDWTSDYQSGASDHVDGLEVRYNNRQGGRVTLGNVRRIGGRKATASAMAAEGRLEPLMPDDPRWNAVVGAAERAIAQCLSQEND